MIDKDQETFKSQIDLLYKQQGPLIPTAFIVASIMASFLWDRVDNQTILTWLLILYSYFVYMAIRLWFYKHKNYLMSARGWAINVAIGSTFSGVMWGSLPFLFLESLTPVYTTLLLVGVMSSTIVNLNSSSAYFPTFATYTLTTMMLVSIALFLDPTDGSNYSAIITLLSMTVTLGFGRHLNANIKESIRLRIEHIDLLEQLEIQKRFAEEANISKSKFLAAASHDLRQPVHALSLFTDALDNMQQLPEDVKYLSGKISQSVKTLDKLFDKLLNISQLDAGTVSVNNEHYNIKKQCEDLLSYLKPQMLEKDLVANVESPIKFTDFTVRSDKLLVRRILTNLLTNAINHSEAGMITIDLSPFKISEQENGIEISIIDTGKGIVAEDLTKIFDEYHQLHNPERDRNKGLGLGLSICKRLAGLLGTKIKVLSELNKGTVFSFVLPQGNAKKIIEVDNHHPAEILLLNFSILVIDDDKDIRDGMMILLKQWGCQKITCAADQFDACRRLSPSIAPDLIISDYRLPDHHNGITAIKAVCKTTSKNIPALLISGDTGSDTMKEIKQSGYLLLHKPVAPAKLKVAMKMLLDI